MAEINWASLKLFTRFIFSTDSEKFLNFSKLLSEFGIHIISLEDKSSIIEPKSSLDMLSKSEFDKTFIEPKVLSFRKLIIPSPSAETIKEISEET